MKKLVVLLLVSFMATSAFATIDPDTDMIGLYFDGADGNSNGEVYAGLPLVGSVVVTTPSAALIEGIEFGYRHEVPAGMESLIFVVPQPPAGIDVGVKDPSNRFGDVILGFQVPIDPAGGNAVVYGFQLVLLNATMPVNTFIGPTSVSGAALPRYVAEGGFVTVGPSTGSVDTPVSSINDVVPVATEEASFGSVKSLFR